MEYPQRKQLRLPNFDYASEAVYFLTICTKERAPILSRITAEHEELVRLILSETGKMVEQYILSITEHYQEVSLLSYIIMPDHVHMILAIGGTLRSACPTEGKCASIPTIIKAFKRFTSRAYNNELWQKRYYDHVIRSEKDLITRMQYIETNPLRYLLKQE